MANQNNNKGGQQQDVNQLLKVRREKLQNLQEAGKDPFQITKYNVTHHSSDVKELYNAHEAEILGDRKAPDVEGLDDAAKREVINNDYNERREIMDAKPIEVSIAGRMMFKRVMGKASFCNIQDLKGNIQVYVARDNVGEDSYADFKKSDIGDIYGVKGFAFRTKTGEISIHAEEITLLSKSLHPAYFTPYSQKVTFSDNVVCPSTVPVTVPLPVPVTAILKGKSDKFLVSSMTVVVPSASVFTTLT